MQTRKKKNRAERAVKKDPEHNRNCADDHQNPPATQPFTE